MPKVPVYNMEGKEVESMDLDAKIFGLKLKPEVVSQVVVSLRMNARKTLAHTKGRSDVRGGGKKPWRQKGTGRARHGSSRSPIWVGGGVTFGPTSERNFKQKINKKVKRQALLMSLSDKVASNNLYVLDSLQFEQPKTKQAVEILKNLKLRAKNVKKDSKSAEKKDKKNDEKKAQRKEKVDSILVVVPTSKQEEFKSMRNIKKVDIMNAVNMGTLDILGHEKLLMTKDTIKKIEKIFNQA